jgi:dolichol-phosphate mannosyltransferase
MAVAEVPYTLGGFIAESNASLRETVRSQKRLPWLRLVSGVRFVKFGLVGASGLAVNMLVLAALTAGAHVFYLASAFFATEASIGWNFVLSEAWVFRKRGRGGQLGRLASFAVLNNAAFALSGPLLWLLVSGLGVNYLLGNLLSITALMFVRFLVSDKLIWREERRPELSPVSVWQAWTRRLLAAATAVVRP